ncbi:hypothetical protein SERLA73DRAFT_169647 [Serpula lacrymans var. lacrymans S7.3]|uniref:5'-Nucleotidase C-terminal domain-containing protein n=1 Tax=Serpula lacrymans var. lacrymans (strain S7.3) TaxID=936435 RepID=F8Q244_SERL3|nr:hypothetical protein SERLA73DRAFT_169647 [Serpula lacrymans var. lacrymans S7.3]
MTFYSTIQTQLLGRFSHDLRSAKSGLIDDEKPLTVFSGDAFSPSLESSVMKGEHIIPVLNHLLVDNFDFGEDILSALSEQCTFRWLLANAVHSDDRLLASAKEHLILRHRGYNIGFFGLAGTDWPSNCQHLPIDSRILDPIPVAQRVSRLLRSNGADLVIALTHMRLEEDIKLAEACSEDVDLILGGHDHDPLVHGSHMSAVNDIFQGKIKIIKSGMDFKSYSIVHLHVFRKDGKTGVENVKVHLMRDISLPKHHPEDSVIHTILSSIQSRMATVIDKPVLYAAIPLDGRSSIVRTTETNLGNMIADAVRAYYDVDIALINSGGLRYILPFDNPFVVKRLPGRTILSALENSVSDIVDGRFFQLSGLSIKVDSCRPVGSRILTACLVRSHSSIPSLVPQTYTVAMVNFIAEGFDGYTLFRDAPVIVSVEGAMTDTALLLQIFQGNVHASCGEGTLLSEYGCNKGEDKTDAAIDRARAAVVVGRTENSLPIVRPHVQGRIENGIHLASH